METETVLKLMACYIHLAAHLHSTYIVYQHSTDSYDITWRIDTYMPIINVLV